MTETANNDCIIIRHLTDESVDAWNEFVFSRPEATFFHRAEWKKVIETAFSHKMYYLYAEQGGRIVGVFPLGHIKSLLFGNALVSSPFCVYGGAIGVDDSVRSALESHAIQIATELGVDYLESRNTVTSSSGWPSKELYVTFRKKISADPDENMNNIPRKQRAMVRKGIKAGLVSETDDSVERFYAVYAESVRNLGTPVFSRRYFRLLSEVFGDDCRILLASRNGKVISGVMSFYFRNEVLPYYGCGTPEARTYKSFDFMYWELMRQSCLDGIEIFDYGRSKIGTGSYSFKKNWGFVPEPLPYQYYLLKADNIPDINPLNPRYQLFIKLWKRLPLPVANVIGPVISRNLG